MTLCLADFDFVLPEGLIARHPASPRDSARLLTVGATLGDRLVSELPGLLRPGDLMVFNDTKVIPAQLSGRRPARAGGEPAKIEITLHKKIGDDSWQSFAKPAKRLAKGERIDVAGSFSAEVLGKTEAGEVTLRFNLSGGALLEALRQHGSMPLPPYIRKLRATTAADAANYQTVYARAEGAVAAPTAGLHFTPALLAALAARGIAGAHLTLHVGAGTFLPVKSERIEEHHRHAE